MTRQDRQLRLGEALPAAVASLARAWGGAWGAILLAVLVWSARPFLPEGFGWPWALAALLTIMMLAGAVSRIGISETVREAKGRGLGPFGLQLGLTELRLLGAFLLCGVFLAMILSVVALVLLAVFGVAGLDAEAIRLRDWAAVGPAWKLILLALVTLGALYAVVVLVVRLSLFAPATVGRGHMVSLNSMGVAQGAFRPLFAGLVVVGAPTIALFLLWSGGLLAGPAGRVVWAVGLNAVQAPLTLGFLGAAYRRLEYWTPQGGAHD